MNEEEKEAVEKIKEELKRVHKINHLTGTYIPIDMLEILLNLIQKQEHEIGLLKDQKKYVIDEYEETIEKQDKIIDKMAEQLAGLAIWNDNIEEALILGDKEEVKEYFKKEVEKDERTRNKRNNKNK